MDPIRERQASGSASTAQQVWSVSNGTRKTILATLAYADAVGTPLTLMQVHQRLVSPNRVDGAVVPSLGETKGLLDELVEHRAVHEENGWYTLSEPTSDAVALRISQMNINAAKWKKMLRKARRLQMVPFVQALFASGSLAAGTTGEKSDWDMFVIAKKNRLYTARIGLLLAARFMGVLRTKSEHVAPDKFCFNHYLADNGLAIRHRSLYVAYALSGLVLVFDRGDYFEQLRQSNGWAGEYLAHGARTGVYQCRDVPSSFAASFVRSTLELFLSWTVGDGLEAILRWWQQRRIAKDPATYERGGRVIANDREIEFHPRSAERAVLARYNDSLQLLGIGAREADSGLL